MHCHAAWTEPGGSRRGGHILAHDSVAHEATEVEAWGFRDIRVATAPDAETNFTLFQATLGSRLHFFQPGGLSAPGSGVFARGKPDEDITLAAEDIAAAHGMRAGVVRDGIAALDLLVVDMAGHGHTGQLMQGENPVSITFDVVLDGTSS